MAMAAMNMVSAGGFSEVSFHLRKCPQGVASVLCKKTTVFGSRWSKLDHLTVALTWWRWYALTRYGRVLYRIKQTETSRFTVFCFVAKNGHSNHEHPSSRRTSERQRSHGHKQNVPLRRRSLKVRPHRQSCLRSAWYAFLFSRHDLHRTVRTTARFHVLRSVRLHCSKLDAVWKWQRRLHEIINGDYNVFFFFNSSALSSFFFYFLEHWIDSVSKECPRSAGDAANFRNDMISSQWSCRHFHPELRGIISQQLETIEQVVARINAWLAHQSPLGRDFISAESCLIPVDPARPWWSETESENTTIHPSILKKF
jgi:hypothetical protein